MRLLIKKKINMKYFIYVNQSVVTLGYSSRKSTLLKLENIVQSLFIPVLDK